MLPTLETGVILVPPPNNGVKPAETGVLGYSPDVVVCEPEVFEELEELLLFVVVFCGLEEAELNVTKFPRP